MLRSPIIIVIWTTYWFHFSDCGTLPASQQAEQTLINSLLSGYNKNIRPNGTVEIEMTASILQIVSIDEKQQIMTSSLFISQKWSDQRLSWSPNSSNYTIEVVMLPVKSLWIPDTMILNSADTSGYLTVSDYSLAAVQYTGQISLILPALAIKTRCSFILRKFPFDRQTCNINLTSWGQGANRLQYDEDRTTVIDTTGYTDHPLWALAATDINIFRGDDRVAFEETYDTVLSIQLFLQRKPLFFMLNGIFACLVLNVVTLLSYALPFGSQVGLSMTTFMTYSVYSLNFSNLFPQQSEYIMLITLFFLLSIVWTLISLVWFIIYNNYTTKSEMPEFLYEIGGQLQKLMICCFPRPKEGEKENEKKHVKGDAVEIENSPDKNLSSNTCCGTRLFPCFCRKRKVENSEKKADAERKNDSQAIETNDVENVKCDFCKRCESCQAEFDKDKAKGKKKKDVEARCNALNYFIFIWVFLFIFVTNMALWLTMAQ